MTTDVDWIVSVTCMRTLLAFRERGDVEAEVLPGSHAGIVVLRPTSQDPGTLIELAGSGPPMNCARSGE